MSETLEFRRINEIEEKIIITSLTKISSEFQQIINDIKKFLYFSTESLTSRSKFPKIFLISKDQYILLPSLNYDRIISAGLYFGFIKKGNFHISLEGAEFLFKNNILSDLKKLYVNDKGEKSILYGNNILKNMIIKFPINLRQKDLLLILNKNDEILAFAQSKFDYQDIQEVKPKDVIAINLIDKGVYLRISQ
ncbi:MAG: hypothetical protein KAV01_05615 [Candidatus Lokiarchaeota archaeon]|nr:hypothetical protein [Candidatus Lokiarchaeota archaeon]